MLRTFCRRHSCILLSGFLLLACLAGPGTGCVRKGQVPQSTAGTSSTGRIGEPGRSGAKTSPVDVAGDRDTLFGRPMTLAELLDTRLRETEVTPERLFALPAEGFEEAYHVQLVREAPKVHLLGGVRSYREGPAGLAVGLEDGTVAMFGGWPCPSVALADGPPVDVLAWHPGAAVSQGSPAMGSPIVVAAGEGEKSLKVFDMRQCGQTASLDLGSRVILAAVSPSGNHVAAGDEVHRLWLGPAAGPLRHVASLRYLALDLAFTPQEGMLMVLDEAGWVTLWSPVDGRLLDKFLIPGGPFTSGSFRDRFARLEKLERPENRDGPRQVVTWDVAARVKAGPDADRRPFALRDGELVYAMGTSRWVRRLVLGRPGLTAAYSRATGIILLRDLDGAARGYSYETGLPVGPIDGAHGQQPGSPVPAGLAAPANLGSLGDLEDVPVAADFTLTVNGTGYRLADPVATAGNRTLYCRAVGGVFYLWWVAEAADSERLPASMAASGLLPTRQSIRADAVVERVPLSGPGEPPR